MVKRKGEEGIISWKFTTKFRERLLIHSVDPKKKPLADLTVRA